MIGRTRILIRVAHQNVPRYVTIHGPAASLNIRVKNFSTTPNGPTPGSGSPIGDVMASVNDTVSNVATTVATMSDSPAALIEAPGMMASVVMSFIENIHVMADVPYWGAIALGTLALRVTLFPIVLKTLQNSARLAIVKPEMEKVQNRMKADPNIDDMRVKMKYQLEMKALFNKHQVNPFRAMLWPVFQIPIFIAAYMGMSQMGLHYPDFATGGALWFTDLGMRDALYILPIYNSLSFLYMIEQGSDGFQPAQQGQFKMVMRALAVVMIPVTANLPASVFVYWASNNTISIVQTILLKNETLRKFFNIPKTPEIKKTPTDFNPIQKIIDVKEAIKKEIVTDPNAKAEILDGAVPPPPPTSLKPPPQTFSQPPKK